MTTVKMFRIVLLAAWMSAAGCDDAPPIDPGDPVVDLGPAIDGALPDRGVTDAEPLDPDSGGPDMGGPDMADRDMGDPDMAVVDPDMAVVDPADPTPGAPGVVAGGAQRASDRFQMTVTVGGAAPTAARQSTRFQTRIGVGIPSISAQGAP